MGRRLPTVRERHEALRWRLDFLLRQIGDIKAQLNIIMQKEVVVAGELQTLQDQVAQTKSVQESAVQLLQGLHQQLVDAIASGDPAALQALADDLKASTNTLADAVVQNT